jgi:RNA polymerase sigma factor (sigma-70 family)
MVKDFLGDICMFAAKVVSPGRTIYDEESLVRLLKQQSRPAFEYLYHQYSTALLGIIMKSIENEDTANDLLQDVFVKIWKNIESYQPERGRLYTWMLNIARNSAIDFLRSKQAKKENKNQTIEDVVYFVDRENSVDQQTDTIGIKTLLDGLSEDQRIALEYVYFKGYTQDDASKELNLPLGTVKTRIRAAIMELRKQFKEELK